MLGKNQNIVFKYKTKGLKSMQKKKIAKSGYQALDKAKTQKMAKAISIKKFIQDKSTQIL
jgi:hypothetical protein